MILCDAGVLFCLVDRTQPKHKAYRNAIPRLALPLITTWSCVTEAMYLALHRGGWPMQKQLRQLLLDQLLIDATLVLAAEKTGHRQILTLDSDFLFYRINDRESFDVIQVEE